MVSHNFTSGTPANSPTVFLSDDDLRKQAPSIFAEAAHESRSTRFAHIPTSVVIQGLRREGFQPVKVTVARVRDTDRKGFEKHMIRFRQNDIVKVGDLVPEVVMTNAHDGSSAGKLSAGIFRLLCSNGLVVSAGPNTEISVRHTGRAVEDFIEGAFRILSESQLGIEVAGRWSQLQLTDGEAQALAIGAHHARFADPEGNIDTPIQPAQLLRPRRIGDQANDLWTVFNRVQENVIKGGLHAFATDAKGKRRKVSTREVKGIDGNLNLNKAMWKMAEHLASLRGVN